MHGRVSGVGDVGDDVVDLQEAGAGRVAVY
jgi:hypothetical protein